jgi:hypothetical protein
MANRAPKIISKMQSPFMEIALEHRLQARLVDCALPSLETRKFIGIYIYTPNSIPLFSKANT